LNPSRRAFMGALAVMSAACRSASSTTIAPVQPIDAFDVVDLSHTLGPGSPYIHVQGATFPFRREPIATIATRGVYANRWELTEHIGTHFDAPCHFAEGAACVDTIPLTDLFAEAVVIDLSRRAAADPDAELTVEDLAAWRAELGPFPKRCAILLCSGWSGRWPSQDRVLSSAGKWALECLTNLSRLPRRGARLFIGVPKVERASGSPARVIAWVPSR
jgi:kynurenine formamidase